MGEGGAEQQGHDRVDEQEDAQRLQARDEVGGRASCAKRRAMSDGDEAEGDAGAAERLRRG